MIMITGLEDAEYVLGPPWRELHRDPQDDLDPISKYRIRKLCQSLRLSSRTRDAILLRERVRVSGHPGHLGLGSHTGNDGVTRPANDRLIEDRGDGSEIVCRLGQ